MGKIKDKLYYFLVQKNPSICKEYQGYVDSHKEEHLKNRKKHWKLLLRLNWHYRIRRKKTPLLAKPSSPIKPATRPATKLPYLEGAESASTGKITPLSLVRTHLLPRDVISFDVFDTLILRPFDDPKTLFIIMGEQLGIYDFYTIRTQSEQEARANAFSKYGNYEVTIEDIYEIIEKRCGIKAEDGIKIEFELEKKYCFANPYFKSVFKFLREQNKRIVICSDMYLHENQIRELLANCGYSDFTDVYVS